MKTSAFLFAVLLLIGAPAAMAAGIQYLEDPPYQQINKDDPNPMEDVIGLAEQGDQRAQYILGDLYGKGKGGLGKNQVKSRYWFERSARGGYTPAFIRLAAQAKRAHDYIAAAKWYTLDADHGERGERKWSKDARADLIDSGKLKKADLKLATKAADEWLDDAPALLKEQRASEQRARDYAQAHPKDDLAYLDADNATEAAALSGGAKLPPKPKSTAKPAPAKAPAPAPKQEKHYND